MDYWKECVEEAFEDAKIEVTKEQIDTVISWVEGAHNNYGMRFGYDCSPNPLEDEIKILKKELEKDTNRFRCPECIKSNRHDCYKCGGEGWVHARCA